MFTEKQLKLKVLKNLAITAAIVILALVIVALIGGKITKDSFALHQNAALTHLLASQNSDSVQLKEKLAPWVNIDAQIESAFPTTDNILDFVGSMEALANKTQVAQTLRFGTPVPLVQADESLSLSTLDYTLTLTGSVNHLAEYLKNFETLPFFTQIQSINLTSNNGWENESIINLKANLYIRNK